MLKAEDMVILPGIIEQISVYPEESGICWLTAREELILVTNMSDDHLARTISMLLFTDRVRSRGVYREDGSQIAIWTRFEWADYLQKEDARRNG